MMSASVAPTPWKCERQWEAAHPRTLFFPRKTGTPNPQRGVCFLLFLTLFWTSIRLVWTLGAHTLILTKCTTYCRLNLTCDKAQNAVDLWYFRNYAFPGLSHTRTHHKVSLFERSPGHLRIRATQIDGLASLSPQLAPCKPCFMVCKGLDNCCMIIYQVGLDCNGKQESDPILPRTIQWKLSKNLVYDNLTQREGLSINLSLDSNSRHTQRSFHW